MYYKIENKESEIYKSLFELRQKEMMIEKENRKAIEEKILNEWDEYLGYFGQQNFERVARYIGFNFINTEEVDLNVWKMHKDGDTYFVPNLRTKAGREMRDFLNSLGKSSFFTLAKILGFEPVGSFAFPVIDIAGDLIVIYMDEKWIPEDKNFIEITSKEFEELRREKIN
jgi:hypothetical protein